MSPESQLATDIARNVDKVSESLRGPRFLFEEFIEELTGMIRQALNDARAQGLRDAAEIVRQQDQIIHPRPTAKKIVGLIEAAADKLQPDKTLDEQEEKAE